MCSAEGSRGASSVNSFLNSNANMKSIPSDDVLKDINMNYFVCVNQTMAVIVKTKCLVFIGHIIVVINSVRIFRILNNNFTDFF